MDEESAKAVQELAKAGTQALQTTEKLGGFVSRFVAGPLQQITGIVEDRLRYTRWELQLRLMDRADTLLKLRGLDVATRNVPLKLALPLLEAASIEDDESLQDRFAMLLVNAADAGSEVEVRRAYISILEQLTPLDALLVDLLYGLPFDQARHHGICTTNLPHSARVVPEGEFDHAEPSDEVVLSLSNLVRLGCLKAAMTFGGGEMFGRVNPTILGREFAAACRLPVVS
ncbi:MAG TPA: Abi-alpha family protein [Burkholderiaceae bacterium]|jgi:hypothetical protein